MVVDGKSVFASGVYCNSEHIHLHIAHFFISVELSYVIKIGTIHYSLIDNLNLLYACFNGL